MLALVIAAALQAAQSDDIVVVGEKMKHIRLVVRHDRCVIRRSGGVAALDAAVCDAALACTRTQTQETALVDCLSLRMPAIAKDFAKH